MEWKSCLIKDEDKLFYTIEHDNPCGTKMINILGWWPWCYKCGNVAPEDIVDEARKNQTELDHAMSIMDGYRQSL